MSQTRRRRHVRAAPTSCYKLLRPHKQSQGWNVLALSNGRWKLPDDQFCALLQQYVADLPHHLLRLVVKKCPNTSRTSWTWSSTKGVSVGRPMEVLKVVVGALTTTCATPPSSNSSAMDRTISPKRARSGALSVHFSSLPDLPHRHGTAATHLSRDYCHPHGCSFHPLACISIAIFFMLALLPFSK